MHNLIAEIRKCKVCLPYLPNGVNPVMSAHAKSRIVIIGQAPGLRVHRSGVPWDDISGDRLREWLGVTKEQFYNPEIFALMPMGFCYPGKGKNGDLPPRKECAPLWHNKALSKIENLQLTILIGSYAQEYYLGDKRMKTLTETVRHFRDYLPGYLPLPHPSPRNNIWIKNNPWFETQTLRFLKERIGRELS